MLLPGKQLLSWYFAQEWLLLQHWFVLGHQVASTGLAAQGSNATHYARMHMYEEAAG